MQATKHSTCMIEAILNARIFADINTEGIISDELHTGKGVFHCWCLGSKDLLLAQAFDEIDFRELYHFLVPCGFLSGDRVMWPVWS